MGIEQRRRIIRENVHIVIASLGSRAHGLRLSVWNALPFAEHIYLSLHGYDSVPDWAKDPKIKVRLSQKCGNNGTADKFWWSKQIRQSGGGYVIHMDDDVIYPKDYVMKMKFAIERYERRAVVCAHGALLTRLPVDNYYKDRRCFHFNYALAEDTFVHVPGIVATAYHTDTITLNLQDFIGEHTQDDIYFAVKAQQKKIPIVCIQREAGWLRPNRGISSVGSICDRYRHGCPAVSDTINSLKYWQVHTCEPTQRRVVI